MQKGELCKESLNEVKHEPKSLKRCRAIFDGVELPTYALLCAKQVKIEPKEEDKKVVLWKKVCHFSHMASQR